MGGTIEFIDPAYDEINKKLLKLNTSIDSYLQNIIKPHFTFSTEEISQKDSRDLGDADREKLAKTIRSVDHQNILITHGTFTMQQTAAYLDEQDFGDKKIVLTGSMVPIIGFAASDAGFNLGYVIGSYEHLQPGVYLSMNGGIFSALEVSKNEELFRFE
jgi:L-asparaginase